MKRLLLTLCLALPLALPTGAGAQTFHVVESSPVLPSFEVPNGPGAIVLPPRFGTPPLHPDVRSYDQLLELWQRAGAAYGVPWQVLAAINKIESNFGQNMGPSSAGALGWMQFIPSSWQRWGMDGDGNGVADPWNPEDAVYAAARYLAAAGAHDDLERAVFAYNHAQWYVDDVMALAATFGDDPGLFASSLPGFFERVDYDRRLAQARRRLAAARRSVPQAELGAQALDWRLAKLRRRAGNPRLADEDFWRLERRIAALEERSDRARVRAERAYAELDYAQTALDELRAEAVRAALGGTAPAAPAGAEAGGYVFPVGGGPEIVSVAHTHHDYPAADIAAPLGSPLYALANATVTESYPEGNGKCGIGLKLRTETGVVFVYCHLSFLEPHVVPGASLAAGASVGLVGSTGHSTGPHLHLAFDPAVAYPQDEPWFESLAGQAFSWQDAPTPAPRPAAQPTRAADGPVYRVVRERVIRFTVD